MNGTTVDLAILGLARDCAKTLPNFFRLVAELKDAGTTTLIIVGENGSRDGTRDILLDAEHRGILRVEDTSFMAKEPRFKRMALGREAMADALRKTGVASNFVCVLDLDGPMKGPPALAGLHRAMLRLQTDTRIFAIAATSRPSYYDLIAFDDGNISFEGLPDDIRKSQFNPIRYYYLFQKIIFPAQAALTSDSELRCISAFNGLSLYRTVEYLSGSYCTDTRFDICEHLSLNRSIASASGKHMIVDPCLRVEMPTEHCYKSFIPFWTQRVRKLAQRL